MQKPFRRFELLLPTRFNNGLPIPNDAFADTLLELEGQFGAVSSESQTIAGQWRHEGQVYRDEARSRVEYHQNKRPLAFDASGLIVARQHVKLRQAGCQPAAR